MPRATLATPDSQHEVGGDKAERDAGRQLADGTKPVGKCHVLRVRRQAAVKKPVETR